MSSWRLVRKGPVIEVRSGGGCVALFGLPFFLAGLFMLSIPVGIIPVQNADEVPAWLILILGLVFSAVGGGLVFGRRGVIMDPRSGQVRAWSGLLVPMKWELSRLDRFNRVVLSKDAGDSDSSDTFPVRLRGEPSVKSADLCAPPRYGEARSAAGEIARFLNLPLEDTSTGAAVTQAPDRIGESLRERTRRDHPGPISLPPQPPDLKTAISENGGELTLVIPEQINAASRKFQIGCTIVSTAIMLIVVIPFLWRLPGPRFAILGFTGLIALLFLCLPLLDLLRRLRREGKKQTIVTVSSWRLRVEEQLGKRSIATELPADEIIELAVPTLKDKIKNMDYPGKRKTTDGTSSGPAAGPSMAQRLAVFGPYLSEGIVALTLRSTLTFGAGLPEYELQYLRALVLKALTC